MTMNGTKIDNAEYHAAPRLSWSKFKVFLKSPLEYKHRFLDGNDPGPTAAMQLGSLVHCLVLEPELFNRDYVVWTGASRATKAGKEEWALIEADGREPVKEADYEHAASVADAVRPHLPEGETELAYHATIAGVECQCKVDRIGVGACYDLKTCADIAKFQRGMEFGDWLLGDTFYRMVIQAATGVLMPPIRYVGVQTTAPNDVLTVHYPADLYEPARDVLLGHLERFKSCQKSGLWPGIAGAEMGLQEIQVNAFALGRLGIALPTLDDMFSADYDAAEIV
jgi:hypothetical protein